MDKYCSATLNSTSEAKGKTILLVDDSATLRSAAVYALERSGHQVIQAVDGLDQSCKRIPVVQDGPRQPDAGQQRRIDLLGPDRESDCQDRW